MSLSRSGIISSCRKLASETPPMESVSVDSTGKQGMDRGRKNGIQDRSMKKLNHQQGLAKSCRLVIIHAQDSPDRDQVITAMGDEEDHFNGRSKSDGANGHDVGYFGIRHLLQSNGNLDEQEQMDVEESMAERMNRSNLGRKRATIQNDHRLEDDRLVVDAAAEQPSLPKGSSSVKQNEMIWFRQERGASGGNWRERETKPTLSDDLEFEPEARFSNGTPNKPLYPEDQLGISQIKRKLSDQYDDYHKNDRYVTLPFSTHTLLHTEPVNSIAFLFSLGIAFLSASCLLLVLINEMSDGEKGNWLDVHTGVTSGVRGAQFCGIFVGLLMEEEIPQGLILLRSISRASLRKSYPELHYWRFVLSCLLRLVMGYLFLLNLFVTIVQADDVISIFFDILALEFVQHLDDMAFELGRKDILGRSLHVATSVEYKVFTREALKIMGEKHDEGVSLIQRSSTNEVKESKSRFYCLRRRKKKVRVRWLLKAAYFINLAGLLSGTIIIGLHQKGGRYHCGSISVNFGDHVWENAYVTNGTYPTQDPREATLVYSYFNGVYKITGSDPQGYPIYTEQNKISGDAYHQTVGAEIVYCEEEEAWVFRHRDISKVGVSSEDEDGCFQWLLRSPPTTAYDLIDVPKEDWSVWTGIITPGNEVSILCNLCSHNSDCNYHGECLPSGECRCDPGFRGFHCEFEDFCGVLIDDEGETFKIATDAKNKTLVSYMRPIYQSRAIDFAALLLGQDDITIATEQSYEADATLNDSSANSTLTYDQTSYTNASIDSTTLALFNSSIECLPSVQIIRLESTTGEQIHMLELQALSSGINVALQGTAIQSSDFFNGETLAASLAIDGSNVTFSHTNDPNAFWEVDLGQPYFIERVIIVNRYCGNNSSDPIDCLCRLSNATLSLLNTDASVIASRNIGNSCGELTLSEYFDSSLGCPSVAPSFETDQSMNNSFDETESPPLDDNIFDFALWGAIALVFSGSRWFATLEFTDEIGGELSGYTEEYHAFWNDLYEGKTYFISDPTQGATPVGTDFYERDDTAKWNDYGPFGLLIPFHNISGKGYFHCIGTNVSAVDVASGDTFGV